MDLTNEQQAGGRHPWLDVFLGSPATALSDLLGGYADIPPYGRADAPDVALRLFKGLDRDDPALQALSAAILTWLEERRARPLPAARPKLQRDIREVCEAFEIVALLDLPQAAIALRRGFIRWNDWVDGLALSDARDARAAYWRMLALTQPMVSESTPGLNAYGLMPMWQEVCREAGGPLPRHYLSIGLLGLRRLPNSERELQWLSGLAQWAMARQPNDAEFRAEWFGLKHLYPRAPDHWRRAVDTLLSAPTFIEVEPPAWWHVDPDLAPMAKPSFRHTGARLRSPMPQEAWDIVDRLHEQPYSEVLPAIEGAAARHRLFLESTGDPKYFVRFIHAVGTALIDDPVRSARTARAAQALAREGLKWDPRDPYLLSLWQNALAAEGAFETAELVGWESIRRNPDNSDARAQLATLLVEMERPKEAASLLKQAVARFPENAVSRSQLAMVLAERLGRPHEAEAMLREAIELFPEDVVSRNQLAMVLAERLGRPDEAETILREAIRLFPGDAVSRNQLSTVLADRLGRPGEAEAVLREAITAFPKNAVSRIQLSTILANSGRPEEAATLLREAHRLRGPVEIPDPEDARADAAAKVTRPAERDGPVVPRDSEGPPSGDGPTDAASQPEHESEAARLRAADPAPLLPDPSEIEEAPTNQHPSIEVSAPVAAEADHELETVLRFGYLRRLRFRLEVATDEELESSLGDLRRVLAEDSGFTYAEVIAARHGILVRDDNALPAVAAAFEDALSDKDRDLMEQLVLRRPRLRGLILVARALFGDQDAQNEIERLLNEPDTPHSRDVSEGLRTTLRPVLRLIRGGQPLASALDHGREAVLIALYDANEAMLGGMPIAA